MVSQKQGGGLVHRLMRWWREPSLADHLIQAEIDGAPSREEDAVLEARIRALGPGQKCATPEETLAARRFRAIVTYGTEEEDPEEIALLTSEERERLEPIAIQSRWARFWRREDEVGASASSSGE